MGLAPFPRSHKLSIPIVLPLNYVKPALIYLAFGLEDRTSCRHIPAVNPENRDLDLIWHHLSVGSVVTF